MNTEKERKELHEEGNKGESEYEKTPESLPIITPHVTNPSPEILLISTIRSLHDHDHIIIEERERRERIVARAHLRGLRLARALSWSVVNLGQSLSLEYGCVAGCLEELRKYIAGDVFPELCFSH